MEIAAGCSGYTTWCSGKRDITQVSVTNVNTDLRFRTRYASVGGEVLVILIGWRTCGILKGVFQFVVQGKCLFRDDDGWQRSREC